MRPERYLGRVGRLVDLRYLVDEIKDCNYDYALNKARCTRISPVTYHEWLPGAGSGLSRPHVSLRESAVPYEALYMCWATDLLPGEIRPEWAALLHQYIVGFGPPTEDRQVETVDHALSGVTGSFRTTTIRVRLQTCGLHVIRGSV